MRNRFNIPNRKLRKRFNKESVMHDGAANTFYEDENIEVNQHLRRV